MSLKRKKQKQLEDIWLW